MKKIAITVALFLVFTCGMAFAVNTSPVLVVNTPAQAVPVSAPNALPVTGSVGITGTVPISAPNPLSVTGSVGIISGTVGVTNTQASPLFVTSSGGPPTTSVAYYGELVYDLNNPNPTNAHIVTAGTFDVSKCAQIRVGAVTTYNGDSITVYIYNDLSALLGKLSVGSLFGTGNVFGRSSLTALYETPGINVTLYVVYEDVNPTATPNFVAMYCR
jgi:hypothetical protein